MQTIGLEAARENLKKYWGYPDFRDGQARAIKSVLDGRDTVVLFPTGGGKSICYQLPATLLDGLTVVISPLIALMQDQVNQLNKAGIRSAFINSTIPYYEVEQRLINARNGMYKLLYIAPERLSTNLWKSELPNLNISLVAIDEAHCISQWGHEFRPSYRMIREELEELPDAVRWVALTATATPEVRDDIVETLKFEKPEIVANGFERDNLIWWVSETDKKNRQLLKAVKKGASKGSGIVYAGTRRECEQWADLFQKRGITAKAYHAGFTGDERNRVQQEWLSNKIQVVVATNAFGMGIDKPDCRFVIHYNPPYSVEAYYQEAGRAGRDSLKSFPVLLYKSSDFDLARSRILKNYPTQDELIKTYMTVCDELNIAVGNEQEKPEPLNIHSVVKRSQMSKKTILSALNVLERLNLFEIAEHRVPQIGIHFIKSSDLVQKFIRESKQPAKSEFLDNLQRLFGPVSFREHYYLDLPYILEKMDMNENRFRKALRILSEHERVISYHWLSEEPLVKLLNARMVMPPVSKNDAEGYRNVILKKLEYMQMYCSTDLCREIFLRRYFGESNVKPCGHCDNCMKKNSDEDRIVGEEEFKKVKSLISDRELSVQEIKKETCWPAGFTKKVLSMLVREDKIRASNDPVPLYSWRKPSAESAS